jgi:DNA-binding IclR family transcriptional regulator
MTEEPAPDHAVRDNRLSSSRAGDRFSSSRSGVKSAVRTVALLEYLAARHDSPARLREISAALDMPRSSAHALLRTLVTQGWVRSDQSGTLYGIGVRALLVGTTYLDSDPYLPLITPFLDDLRNELDETFHLARLDHGDVVYLATRESTQYTRTSNRVGRRLPAYATALGKSLLAERFGTDRDEHVPTALRPLTQKTIADRRKLDDTLDDVRVRGYATDDEESTAGVRCFAVALRYCQPPQDAISASVPIDRLNPRREREIVDALCTMGDKISRVVRPLANGDKWLASRVSGE